MQNSTKHTVPLLLALLTGCYGASDVLERDGGARDVAAPLGDVPGLLDAPVYFLDAPGSDAPRFLADAPLGDGAEVWEGYVEGFTFRSGSDHVRVALDSATGDGPRTGTVIFGMGTPPPPARDPLVGYPSADGTFPYNSGIYEAFAYRVETGTRTADRTQLTVSGSSLWADWCQLQTPYTEMEQWGCLPPARGYGGAGGGRCAYDSTDDPPLLIPVDCGQLWLCLGEGRGVCTCSAAGCVHSATPTHTLDFRATSGTATGTLVLDGVSHVIHLTRMP